MKYRENNPHVKGIANIFAKFSPSENNQFTVVRYITMTFTKTFFLSMGFSTSPTYDPCSLTFTRTFILSMDLMTSSTYDPCSITFTRTFFLSMGLTTSPTYDPCSLTFTRTFFLSMGLTTSPTYDPCSCRSWSSSRRSRTLALSSFLCASNRRRFCVFSVLINYNKKLISISLVHARTWQYFTLDMFSIG